MEQMKAILENKKLVYIGGGVIVGFIIILFLILSFRFGRSTSYQEMEQLMIKATTKYLQDHPLESPTSVQPEITLSSSLLVDQNYLKPLDKLRKDNCSAEVVVHYKEENHLITPYLSCQNYESTTIYDQIVQNNPIVSSYDGLYEMNQELVFRGDKVNNYLLFHDVLWRIVKLNPENQTISLILEDLKTTKNDIWDNRYNTVEESKNGINDFEVSIIRDSLFQIYSSQFEKVRHELVPMNVCIGKRSPNETNKTGDIECSYFLNTKLYVSLLPLYDYMNASLDSRCLSSLDRGCSNYNYLVNSSGKWWTLTADGSKGTKVYGISNSGVISSDHAITKKSIRYMILLDGGSLLYLKGDGTKDSPFEIH
ncbi:MAG: hypothetical protein HFH86_00165 [Bacilli bacterium]|jgi:hypothetical protein|nr:hypothetical protein [Bacilli bacterium]